jgi:hypothetical protein
MDEAAAHEALSYYLIDSGNAGFRIQHMVDAYAAETAGPETKPIQLVFALVGLFLHLERGYSGAMVQKAHAALAKGRKNWPSLALPAERGAVGIQDVMNAPAGPERDAMMERWCLSVWQAYEEHHELIRSLPRQGSETNHASGRGN